VQENLVIQVRLYSRGSGAVVFGAHGERRVIALDAVRGTFGPYGLNGAAYAMAESQRQHLRSLLWSIRMYYVVEIVVGNCCRCRET
jgi:hypothetical protein